MTRESDSGAIADLAAHSSAPEGGSDRAFGYVFAVVFTVIAAWPLLADGAIRWWSLGIAAAFALLAAVHPAVLRPLNRLWVRLGVLLGRIVSPIVLGIVYCLAVVPTGLWMRLAGKDPLRRRFDEGARTYWIERKPPIRPDDTMKRPF
ncbi:MAG: SxtJ family membrane protein [Gammaproteobacteria bacterium]